jgi:hypothetical protein
LLHLYASLISSLPPEARRAIREYFDLPGRGDLVSLLLSRGLFQADVVLALLRRGQVTAAEVLIGRPITHCPTSRLPPVYSSGAVMSDYISDYLDRHPSRQPEPRVTWVNPNPSHDCRRGGRSLTTPSFYRYRLVQAGMTLQQLLTRGVTLRDIRQWRAWGWVVVEQQHGH